MQAIARRWIKLALQFGIALLVASGAAVLWKALDKTGGEAAQFVERSPKVYEVIGQVKSISLDEARYVAAAPREPAYRRYFFIATGEKANALVIVRVDRLSEDGPPVFSIDSIEILGS